MLPFLRVLGRAVSHGWLAGQLPGSWTYIWNGALTRTETGVTWEAAEELAVSLAAAGLVDEGERGGASGQGEGEQDEIEDDDD